MTQSGIGGDDNGWGSGLLGKISYIPQTGQHLLIRLMLLHLGNVTIIYMDFTLILWSTNSQINPVWDIKH